MRSSFLEVVAHQIDECGLISQDFARLTCRIGKFAPEGQSPVGLFTRYRKCCCSRRLPLTTTIVYFSDFPLSHLRVFDLIKRCQWCNSFAMSAAGTFRGTPKGKPQTAGFSDSPSNIPRPKLESAPSEASTSFSASRAKQSKRDEVWRT